MRYCGFFFNQSSSDLNSSVDMSPAAYLVKRFDSNCSFMCVMPQILYSILAPTPQKKINFFTNFPQWHSKRPVFLGKIDFGGKYFQ